VSTDAVEVTTSGRLEGRTRAGVAGDLRAVADGLHLAAVERPADGDAAV